MSTVTVQIEALKADLTAYDRRDVIVTLVAGTAGATVGNAVVAAPQVVTLDEAGQGTIALTPNDEVDQPTDTFYRFTVKGSSPTIERTIRLTAETSDPVSWSDESIQVVDLPSFAGVVAASNLAKLDDANVFTDGPQTVVLDVPHLAPGVDDLDVQPARFLSARDGDEEVGAVFAAAVEVGGDVFHYGGARWARIGLDGEPTGYWTALTESPYGIAVIRVPGPLISDLPNLVLEALFVGAPTQAAHAATKAYVDTATEEAVGSAGFATSEALAAEVSDRQEELAAEASNREDGDEANLASLAKIPHVPTAAAMVYVGNAESGGAGCRFKTPAISWTSAGGHEVQWCSAWDSLGEGDFGEILTIPQLEGGARDILEIAYTRQDGEVTLFMEWTPLGEAVERAGVLIDTSLDPDWNGPVRGVPEWYRATIDFATSTGAFWRRIPVCVKAGDVQTTNGRCWRKIFEGQSDTAFTALDYTGLDWMIGFGEGRRGVAVIEQFDGIDGTLISSFDASRATLDGDGIPVSVADPVLEQDWTYDPDEFADRPKASLVGTDLASLVRFASDTAGGGSGPDLSDVDPQPPGAADPGTSSDASRADHVHAPPSAGQIGAATPSDVDDAVTAHAGATDPHGDRSWASSQFQPVDSDLTALAALTSPATKIPSTVVLGSDQGSSSTTLADTTGLAMPVTSGVAYIIDIVLWVTGATAGDCKVALTFPSGTAFFGWSGPPNSASSTPTGTQTTAVVTASGGTFDAMATLDATTIMHVIKGYFLCASSGTLQVQHAQRNSSGTATTIKAGSFIESHTV